MTFWIYKQSGALKPATEADRQKIGKIENGQPVQLKYVRVRNPKLHRLYFKFIEVVYENLPEKYDKHWPSKQAFRKSMQMYAGYFEETVTLKGERLLQPKSIAYEKLDDVAFGELYKGIKKVVGKYILPNIDDIESEARITQFF